MCPIGYPVVAQNQGDLASGKLAWGQDPWEPQDAAYLLPVVSAASLAYLAHHHACSHSDESHSALTNFLLSHLSLLLLLSVMCRACSSKFLFLF